MHAKCQAKRSLTSSLVGTATAALAQPFLYASKLLLAVCVLACAQESAAEEHKERGLPWPLVDAHTEKAGVTRPLACQGRLMSPVRMLRLKTLQRMGVQSALLSLALFFLNDNK